MSGESGFAFIIMLIFIGIISGVMLSMSHSTLFEIKTIENFLTYYHRIYLTDVIFERVKQDIIEENIICSERWCSISAGFLKNAEKVSYTFHHIQTVPCFHVNGSEALGADFFKASVKIISGIDALEVERTFVKGGKNAKNCLGIVSEIDSGYLGWRVVQ